jgi:hypothetical protein
MLSGAILVLLGFAIRWKTSAYDLKDAAIDSAWTLARGKRTADNPTALEAKYRDIQNQPTWTGKATRTAGTVAGHFIAHAALIMMLAGLALGVAGFLWR